MMRKIRDVLRRILPMPARSAARRFDALERRLQAMEECCREQQERTAQLAETAGGVRRLTRR